jgi:hypothetical protein
VTAGTLVCPSCGVPHADTERFCADCGLPLVRPDLSEEPPRSALAERARKIHKTYAEGPLVRAAWARNQAEAELIQGLLLEEGIPSVARRSGGFDVPDFLASGPRVVLVASGGLDAAQELLGDPSAPRRMPVQRYSARMRIVAVTLAFMVFMTFAASFTVPFFD